jgi:hypothetical protein
VQTPSSLLADAIGLLLEAGATERTLRGDVDPMEVLTSLGGTMFIAGQQLPLRVPG